MLKLIFYQIINQGFSDMLNLVFFQIIDQGFSGMLKLVFILNHKLRFHLPVKIIFFVELEIIPALLVKAAGCCIQLISFIRNGSGT
jgi:hypothetical protein